MRRLPAATRLFDAGREALAAVFTLLTLAGSWAALPGQGRAQSPEHGPLVLELPASTRGLALGGAFYTVGNDSDAVFHNPALIGGNGIIGASMQRFGAASLFGTVSGAAEWSSASVAVGVRTLGYGAPEGGAAVLSQDAQSLFSSGGTGTSEVAISVGTPARCGASGPASRASSWTSAPAAITTPPGPSTWGWRWVRELPAWGWRCRTWGPGSPWAKPRSRFPRASPRPGRPRPFRWGRSTWAGAPRSPARRMAPSSRGGD